MNTCYRPYLQNKNGDISNLSSKRSVSQITMICVLFEHFILSCRSPLIFIHGIEPNHGADVSNSTETNWVTHVKNGYTVSLTP